MKDETPFYHFLHHQALAGKKRIGIGILNPDDSITDSLIQANALCHVVAFGKEVPGIESIPVQNIEKSLISSVISGRIDGLVRGQADAILLRKEISGQLNYPFEQLKDLALVKDVRDRIFVMCPVAHTQGWTVTQKVDLIREAVNLLNLLSLPVKAGIMSGARPAELGLNQMIDQTYADAGEVVALLSPEIPIQHYYIDMDKALADHCTILVPVNGISGNDVLRALAFFGNMKIYGGIIAGIKPLVVESFRNSPGFFEYLEFANALANLKKA